MTDREKVIRGLECCLALKGDYCDNCPYSLNEWECDKEQLKKDALELLKAQEPRVMTLDEVVALPEDSVVWLEDNDKPDVIAGLMGNSNVGVSEAGCVVMLIRFVVIRDGGIIKVTGNAEDYMTRWRCWTSRPTAEQREATSWN